MKEPALVQFGDHGVLIQYPKEINQKTHRLLTQYTHHLIDEFAELIEGFTTAYHESAIYLNPDASVDSAIKLFKQQFETTDFKEKQKEKATIIHVPVCYEAPFALDIEEIAKQNKIEVSEIIELHSAAIYPVYFIGFAPGFPYLGEVDKAIAYPRKSRPRKKIEAGAVGIAGKQTGIYPNTSPGGWNIIGRSPLRFFNAQKDNPSLLRSGDYIRFESITKEEYKRIKNQVENGTYKLKKSNYND